MAKLQSTFRNMVLVLSTITLVAAAALGSVYNLTKEPIEASKRAKKENAIREVLPEFDRLNDEIILELPGLSAPFFVYPAFLSDVLVGAAVQSYTRNGFSGEIKVMVGFDIEGNIVNYAVLEQKETPGLGTKIVDWFKTDKGQQDIRGKHVEKNNLTVTKTGGEVDAITAATISSVAFLEAVKLAYDAFLKSGVATQTIDIEKSASETNNEGESHE